MRPRHTNHFILAALAALMLAACGPITNLPEGPTPIPTLVPVTELAGITEPTQEPSFAILSYPASPPSASEGQRIYEASCADCHGEDGTGAVPAARNFKDLDYVRGESPANLYAVVTEGRGTMPSYSSLLSSDQRWDAVFYIWQLSTTAEFLEIGKSVYDDNCAACHGADGSGELLGSADFTDLRQMDELAPRDLYLAVTQGRGSMPAWQSRLSQDERWAVIDYLRTFSYEPSLEGGQGGGAPVPGPTVQAAAECDPEQANPFAWNDQAAIQAGSEMYAAQCAACHGEDGSGGLPNTPDFTSSEVATALREAPGESYCTLTVGVGGMPAFGPTLSEEARWQLLTFLGSLSP